MVDPSANKREPSQETFDIRNKHKLLQQYYFQKKTFNSNVDKK